MLENSEIGRELVTQNQDISLTTDTHKLFAATLESIKDLAQKLAKSKELKENLRNKLFSFFDADSFADLDAVLNQIYAANRGIQDLMKKKAQMNQAINLKRELDDEEKAEISGEVERSADKALSEIISKSVESALTPAEEQQLDEIYIILKSAHRIYCQKIHPDANLLDQHNKKMNSAVMFSDLISVLLYAKDIVGMTKLSQSLKDCSGNVIKAYQLYYEDYNSSAIDILKTQLNEITVEIVGLNIFVGSIQPSLSIGQSVRFDEYYDHLKKIISRQKDELVKQNIKFKQAKESAIAGLEKTFAGTGLVNVEKSEIKNQVYACRKL